MRTSIGGFEQTNLEASPRATVGLVQRAMELANSGDCATITQIAERLRKEQYGAVASNLSGGGIRRQLRALMKAARAEKAAKTAAESAPPRQGAQEAA